MCIGDYAKGTEARTAGGEGTRADKPGIKPRSSQREAGNAEASRARLVRTIEGEIVPRLVLARRVVREDGAMGTSGCGTPDETDVLELVRLLMQHELGVATAYVETVRQRGATLDLICLELLAPAARELGRLWEYDECDFLQVTLALCRLHQLLRELSAEFRGDEFEHERERRILLAPCPGEQHTFGVSVVGEFLQRAGWEVLQEFPDSTEEILNLVRRNWFAVVGLSVGSERKLEEIAAMIRAIRGASMNRSVGVLVGGPMLLARPEIVQFVGADGTAPDGPQAVLCAEHFCSMQSAVNG
jgi:MerR family transcriptional regulator, light-induced transcriptional regulator